MFKGYEVYETIVCSLSDRKRMPCRMISCKHHKIHLPKSQSGVEYTLKNMKVEGWCNGQRT